MKMKIKRTIKSQEKALTRKLRVICRKHRIAAEKSTVTVTWSPYSTKMTVGNFILVTPPSPKEARRFSNALPEMRKKLATTAVCCEWRGGLDFQGMEKFIQKR